MEHTSGFGVYFMFPGGTLEQYDAVNDALALTEMPEGMLTHVAWKNEYGLNVSEVWESKESWEAFKKDRLDKALGDSDLPKGDITLFDVHNVM
ncbi:MAG: hypothetical protein PHW10_05545 [Candidatus Peribacteraceae bacterium]|nr:hypothetical protein [Candidatus Peribacteraceae bacterium]